VASYHRERMANELLTLYPVVPGGRLSDPSTKNPWAWLELEDL
jgi:hypothetical protein